MWHMSRLDYTQIHVHAMVKNEMWIGIGERKGVCTQIDRVVSYGEKVLMLEGRVEVFGIG